MTLGELFDLIDSQSQIKSGEQASGEGGGWRLVNDE
jgi:hypothetical protein